jgi:Cu-Zn family superoxide dismutase
MRSILVLALAGAAALVGCGQMHHAMQGHGGGPMARAVLEPTKGNATAGTVMFHASSGGVFMHARITGLKPDAEHGFHIHEKGDCSSGDGMSTGGHFNPTAQPHGPQDAEHHAGDLPALKADANGAVDLKVELRGLSIGQGVTDIVGRGLIVHAMPDDYKTQPTGNSGARIACAVIAALR